jgi:HK97 family phage major capsid protein/HK97 family phage prohead protease
MMMNRIFSQPASAQYRLAPIAEPVVQGASRTISFIFSDGSIDSDGDTIDASGWILDRVKNNAVPALFGHDASTVENVIGRPKNVRVVGSRLLGDIEFATGDINPRAEAVFQMIKSGFLSGVSVGFQPIEWERSKDKSRPQGLDFKRQILLEISVCPVIANSSCLVQAKAAGIDIDRLGLSATSEPRAAFLQSEQDYSSMIRRSASGHTSLASLDIAERRSKAEARAIAIGRPSAFKSFGHFVQAVALQRSGAPSDARLVRAPTGGGEVDPTGGGFLIPDEYLDGLIGSMFEEAVLAPLVDRRETDRPAKVRLPGVSEVSRADGSRWGGVASYWVNEGDQPPASLPKFRMLEFSAKKCIALLVASNELVADVPLLGGHMRRAFAAEGAFKLDQTILKGTGAGQPLGIIGAPGTITVAKAQGQAAGTILGDNISAMWSRLALPCRRRAVWVLNGDAEGQLDSLGTGGATPGTAGLYFPAGMNGNPYPLLKGRPVIFAEQSPTLGTPGDIVLADLSEYLLIDGGLKTALSLHCRWNSDEAIFRFTWRGDGRPAWSTPITPYNGGATQSAFVTLAAR